MQITVASKSICLRTPRVIMGVLTLGFLILNCNAPGDETANKTSLEYKVKTIFLHNFTKFISWPDAAFADEKTPFVLGVIGSFRFGREGAGYLENKTIRGRRIEVRNMGATSSYNDCQILFVSSEKSWQMPTIVKQIGAQPILLVGESPRFIEMGGMINFIEVNGNVRFEINPTAIIQAKLKISSDLLNVAIIKP